jgi:UDP-N-acetylmuramate--alanine ligase
MEHIHLIGIGGTGLSAIARVLLESGYRVTGSDLEYSPLARDVEAAGADVFVGHRADQVNGADLVIRSSAVPDENVEVRAARDTGIPVVKRADFLGQLMEGRRGVAVAGSHGKTTTSAMIAWTLTTLGQDPSFIIGGVVTNLDTNAHAGDGPAFVIEADEYDYMFLGLQPEIAVVTNVEHDHPDMFPTMMAFRQAFREFVALLPPDGTLLVCGDDPGAAELASHAPDGCAILKYGLSDPAFDYFADGLSPSHRGGFSAEVYRHGQRVAGLELQVPGDYNVNNALATLAVVDRLGLSLSDAAEALRIFRGAGRRFEVLGEADGVIVVDDYGHHPTEIRATLRAARQRYPDRRIWAVWQPHTYTRTKTLFDEFAHAFEDADNVVVTEVYRSREPVDPEFSSLQVVKAMENRRAHFKATLTEATAFLLEYLRAGDVVIVFSAGDATEISAQVFTALSQKS